MATSIKHMFLLSVLLLCFLSITTEGRRVSMKLEHKGPEKMEPQIHQMKAHVHRVEPKQVEEHDLIREGSDEVLVGMDYTPASRKSPVHN